MKLADALRAYQRALDLEPDNADARALANAVQAEMAAEEKLVRADALTQIDQYGEEATKLIEAKKFEEAESLLKDANALVPNDDQRNQLRSVLSELYLAWSDERMDKMDQMGAEEKLKLALGANPDNEKVVTKLLALWEDDPQQREHAASVYETLLERNPGDDNLRKKLADIYYGMKDPAPAVQHYLILYKKSPQYQGTELEKRLVEMLDRLHKEYARDKNYEEAIKTYQLMATIDHDADPTAVVNYEYMNMQANLSPNDYEGYLKLANFAQQNGLVAQAWNHYNRLLEGVIVHFPVFVPGALLHVGDGHALQGDGEILGTGIEISFDVTVTVDVIKDNHQQWPRAIDKEFLMTIGCARPLDQCMQHATTEMLAWLTRDHGLTEAQAHLLVGESVVYDVGNMFDPAYTMVCKVRRDLVKRLSA